MTIDTLTQNQDEIYIERPLSAERLLRRLGATGKLAGFHYTVFLLDYVVEKPVWVTSVSKYLYPLAANQFHVSIASVERALRTLIGACWRCSDHRLLNYIAGAQLTRSPSNSEFLDMLAAFLRTMQ